MATNEKLDQAGGETRDQRLRLDAAKIEAARKRLDAIDRMVFAAGEKHTADAHDRLVRKTVTALFDHD